MARLSAEQWAMARADFEIRGLSVTEIARQYGCAKSAVSMRAKADGWQAGKTEQAVTDKVNAIMQLARVEQETELKLNATERAVFDTVVMDDVAFRAQNDADLEAVCRHMMTLLPGLLKQRRRRCALRVRAVWARRPTPQSKSTTTPRRVLSG